MAYSNIQFLSFAFLLLFAAWASAATNRLTDKEMSARHEEWMARYGRVYNDATEKELRFKIFKQNVEHIESVNRAGDRKYKLRVNEFTDMTSEEFISSHTGFLLKPSSRGNKLTKSFRYENLTDVPDSMDWRDQGAVTPIKDQGRCGCCWAFAAVAAVEGIHQINSGTLIALSEQELVDCDINDGGCEKGASPESAFDFIQSNGGLATEDNYPYQGKDGSCNSAAPVAVTISGYEGVPQNSESTLLMAVAQQPVSIAIEASYDFQHYGSGVFTGTCGTDLNHAVAIIGYGEETDGTKYWLIKNQYGTSWGEEGYMKIQRDIAAPEGLCGLAMFPSFPTA